MKPYYEQDGITIFHGDCRDILPHLEPVDLVLTDPPYNVGKDYGVWDDALPANEYEAVMQVVTTDCLSLAPKQFWVAPRYQLPMWSRLLEGSHLVVIRRGAVGPYRGGWSDQFEIALAIGKPSRVLPDLWEDIRLKGEGYFFREDTHGHPGYTPYPIAARAAGVLSAESQTILDPFMGSGTTLRAAKDLGRKSIGIEISEKYCEIAAKRMAQTVMAL